MAAKDDNEEEEEEVSKGVEDAFEKCVTSLSRCPWEKRLWMSLWKELPDLFSIDSCKL